MRKTWHQIVFSLFESEEDCLTIRLGLFLDNKLTPSKSRLLVYGLQYRLPTPDPLTHKISVTIMDSADFSNIPYYSPLCCTKRIGMDLCLSSVN